MCEKGTVTMKRIFSRKEKSSQKESSPEKKKSPEKVRSANYTRPIALLYRTIVEAFTC